jgi:hypothetical protein
MLQPPDIVTRLEQTLSIPTGFAFLYLAFSAVAVLCGVKMSNFRLGAPAKRKLTTVCIAGTLIFGFLYQVILDSWFLEYKNQGVELNDHEVASNLIIPLPPAWLRTKIALELGRRS